MVQKLVFDPQKLIDEEKENEKKKVEEVLTEQEEYDKIVEEQQAKAEKIKDQEKKKGTVATAFDEIKDILKEVNYAKKYGGKKYLEDRRDSMVSMRLVSMFLGSLVRYFCRPDKGIWFSPFPIMTS